MITFMNYRFRSAMSSFTLVLLVARVSPAQRPPTAKTDGTVISSTSHEVLLDVVVRDKKQRLIKDLRISDFEVTDDGAPQKLRAFRLVGSDDASSPSAPRSAKTAAPANATVDPLRQIRLVTLVFDRLGTDARNNARVAVQDFLTSESGSNLFAAVFSIDQRLSVLQQYTSDRDKVQKAVAKVTSSASSLYKSESDQIEEELKTVSVQGAAGAAAPANGQGVPDSGSLASAAMAQMTLNAMQFSQTLDRTLQGRSSIFALKALIQEQYRLPGRKTLLYFSEGLSIPPEYVDEFNNLIGAANRANVSVYGVDARGLTTFSQNGAASALMSQSTSSSRSMQTQRQGPVTRDQVTAADRSEEAIRANSQNSLADISDKTGGFLIANSNDLRGQLHRVAEDMDTHYELSYTPAIDKFDGTFRKISVRVNRADAKIQTRSGYFALPFSSGRAPAPFEISMLSAISTVPPPRVIPFRSSSLHFQTPSGPQSSVVIDVPLQGVEFARDEANKVYRVHFSVMAIYKDAEGSVVQKLSQDVPRQGPLDKIEAFKQGHFLYTQHVELPAGRYTLETAVFDSQTGKAGVKKAVAIVPPVSKGVGISSLAFVRSVSRQPAPASPNSAHDPFDLGTGTVTPGLDDTFKFAPGASVALFFTVYSQPGAAAPPDLTMEFLQDGKAIGRGEPKLPAADKDGRIPYVATSPIGSFKPGQYEVRATVRQNGTAATERTFFTIEE